MDNIQRCAWVDNYPPNEAMRVYHDTEWGKPEYDDDKLFELLSLETYQTGLSWQTVIDKRERFNERFEGYVIDNVAQYDEAYVEDLLQDAGIIRNRAKLLATINNAKAMQRVQHEFGSFAKWLWEFVDNTPIDHQIVHSGDVPAQDALSQQVSKAMKKLGFKFVGPVTVYSFLQGAGLINDHEVTCAFHDVY